MTAHEARLLVEILPDGRRARLTKPLELLDDRGNSHCVPAGFTTDFASVPRALWRLVPPWGPYSPAAVVHDYLYRTGTGTRPDADAAFLGLMKRLGVPAWKRYAMYLAVRAFGWTAWRGARTLASKPNPKG